MIPEITFTIRTEGRSIELSYKEMMHVLLDFRDLLTVIQMQSPPDAPSSQPYVIYPTAESRPHGIYPGMFDNDASQKKAA